MFNIEILKTLMEAESVSPDDAGTIDFLAAILIDNGFECNIITEGAGSEKTQNLYAEYGAKNNNNGKNLCFAGHVDVVPAGNIDSWRYKPFAMTIESDAVEGDKIFGRGAVDMKGAIACMVSACIDYAKTGGPGKISLLITSDEEASGKYGTKIALEWMKSNNRKIDFSIVGEPTSDKEFGDIIKIGRRGSINFELKILGKQGHAAYPHKADNPHNHMIDILHKLKDYKIDDGNQYFDPSNLEIVSIDTRNKVTNLIPEETTALFNVRYSSEKEAEKIIEEIENIIQESLSRSNTSSNIALNRNFTAKYELKTNISARAFLSSASDFAKEFADIVARESGVKPVFGTSGGTSDARFIQTHCPLLEFGLLNETAHQIDEYTKITHLQKLYNVYIGAINSFHSTKLGVK